MHLELNDIVPEALHRQVGWDMRHHFMAEKIISRFALVSRVGSTIGCCLCRAGVEGAMRHPPPKSWIDGQ
jgi:hypothetical protein